MYACHRMCVEAGGVFAGMCSFFTHVGPGDCAVVAKLVGSAFAC